MRILPVQDGSSEPETQISLWKEKMSRLEDAEKRLHGAMARLEGALSTQREIAAEDSKVETGLRDRIAEVEAERDAMEKRMSTAAVRLDATIERLRGALSE